MKTTFTVLYWQKYYIKQNKFKQRRIAIAFCELVNGFAITSNQQIN